MTFFGVVAAVEATLMTRDRVLMRLNAAVGGAAVRADGVEVVQHFAVGVRRRRLRIPAQRQIRGRDNLNKVHEIEHRVVGQLGGVVQRVHVVIRPRHGLRAQFARHLLGDLRPKAQRVDVVRERMPPLHGRIEVVIQVVYVHGAVAETAPGCDMKVADHLIDPEAALDAAPLLALLVEALGIMFTLALLDVFAAAKGPRHGRVGFPHFFARIAAACFGGIGGSGRAVAVSAVGGIKVDGYAVFGVAVVS